MKSDLEIARGAAARPIEEIASQLDVPADAILTYGRDKAKIDLDFLAGLSDQKNGKLVLVTCISPTSAGEGKTTTTVGLGDALSRIGKKTSICLREPSLGPCFGMKGGAAGGGYAQVIPMEDINLHFTGDFHAITAAHNLLAALLDNHIYWGNKLDIDARRITWRRVMDLNDRALRSITQSLGGVVNGFPREDSFDITAASEIMAVFCLASDLNDLQLRLSRIEVARNRDRQPVTALDLAAPGSMTALLKHAIMPNLVQTLEHTPAFVHGGPFANIAHGCNSLIATQSALKLSDYIVTEAGFGADLGAEKFFDIKCRQGGLTPDAVVLVATVRALKKHGGVAKEGLSRENTDAVKAGCANLNRHIAILKHFGVPMVAAINQFTDDSDAEIQAIKDACSAQGVETVACTHWQDGGAGAEDLANKVVDMMAQDVNSDFNFLYEEGLTLWEKIETIADKAYGAGSVIAANTVSRRLDQLQEFGHGNLPICMAKTPMSFSSDPNKLGAPDGHELQIREVRLAAGAGFVVAVCGSMMTMPGLPRRPAAADISVDDEGNIDGLF